MKTKLREEYREYVYGDGSSFRINKPRELYIFEGKSGWTQRVVDSKGRCWRPTPGWLAITWKQEGKPFDF